MFLISQKLLSVRQFLTWNGLPEKGKTHFTIMCRAIAFQFAFFLKHYAFSFCARTLFFVNRVPAEVNRADFSKIRAVFQLNRIITHLHVWMFCPVLRFFQKIVWFLSSSAPFLPGMIRLPLTRYGGDHQPQAFLSNSYIN